MGARACTCRTHGSFVATEFLELFHSAEQAAPFRDVKQSITAHDCPRITAEFLAEERASMGDWRFRQEYMCEFVDTDEQFFSSELIDAMADNELEVWA